eukprot:TRINITY_DN717_c0_g1_i2.p2 TRINITY_DN717_c0_g1~~TRINITY_DN717_c0_g1_i2.p2  ORF type:complete len:261 (+),score=2.55 TRINITY_DN717_c0_g1_i2:10-792(+)
MLRNCIHFIIVVLIFLSDVVNFLSKILFNTSQTHQSQLISRGTKPQTLGTVAIIINENPGVSQQILLNLIKLLNLLNQFGVEVVYLYDREGDLKNYEQIIIYTIEKQKVLENDISEGEYNLNGFQNGCTNGLTKSSQYRINNCTHQLQQKYIFMSGKDTENILHKMLVNQNQIQLQSGGIETDKTLQCLNELVQDVSHVQIVKEADVILVFGDNLSLAGFPPWLTRLSEIFFMGRMDRLHLQDIQDVFVQYRMKNQRFGK